MEVLLAYYFTNLLKCNYSVIHTVWYKVAPFIANGHFFHSTGIMPVKVMEWPGTVRPVALTVLFTKLPASQFTAIPLVCLV